VSTVRLPSLAASPPLVLARAYAKAAASVVLARRQ